MKYTVKSTLEQLGKKVKAFDYDIGSKFIEVGGYNLAEFIVSLSIPGKGKRVSHQIIDMKKNSFETIEKMPLYGLLECLESFGIAVEEVKDEAKKVKNENENENEVVNQSKEEVSATKEKTSKKKENKAKKFTEDELKNWETPGVAAAFSGEIERLRKNKEKLKIKDNEELDTYVKEFAISQYNKDGTELQTINDITPYYVKGFNDFIEVAVIPIEVNEEYHDEDVESNL